METEPAYSAAASIPIREEVKDNVIFHDWGVIEIPLLGSTAAGAPIDFGDIDPDPPTRPWAAALIKGDPKNYYCVAVRGESMTEADIKDGSKRREKLNGDGYEIQGVLEAIGRKPGKRADTTKRAI